VGHKRISAKYVQGDGFSFLKLSYLERNLISLDERRRAAM